MRLQLQALKEGPIIWGTQVRSGPSFINRTYAQTGVYLFAGTFSSSVVSTIFCFYVEMFLNITALTPVSRGKQGN